MRQVQVDAKNILAQSPRMNTQRHASVAPLRQQEISLRQNKPGPSNAILQFHRREINPESIILRRATI
jgi:hypothetical protein